MCRDISFPHTGDSREHSHRVYHFLLCLEGGNSFLINGEKRHFGEGDFAMIDPGISHNINPLTGEFGRFFILTFQYLSGDRELDWPWKRVVRGLTGSHIEAQGHRKDVEQQEKQFLYFLDSLNDPGSRDLPLLGTCFMNFIMSLFLYGREDRIKLPREKASPQGKTIAYIKDNYEKKLTIEELAGIACLSEGYFIDMFHRETGMTPMAFVNNYRLDRAAYLLSYTSLSLKEIAEKCGFSSASYFCKTFKAHTGLSSRAYREKISD